MIAKLVKTNHRMNAFMVRHVGSDSDVVNTTLKKIKSSEKEIQKGKDDKEEKAKTLAIRKRGAKPKFGIKKEDFVKSLREEISHKTL